MLVATTSRDKMVQHLVTQKARAVEERPQQFLGTEQITSRCQYRTTDGRMCAAGCLIPDEKYEPAMEGMVALQVNHQFPGAFPEDITVRELEIWQSYHDSDVNLGGQNFSYGAWVNGDENNHPEKFKEAVTVYLMLHEAFDS